MSGEEGERGLEAGELGRGGKGEREGTRRGRLGSRMAGKRA